MPTITNPNDLTTSVTGLTAGTTKLRFTVVDNFNRTVTKDININIDQVPLTANAGPDKTIVLPTSSVTLTGSATGIVESYLWSQLSGPIQAGVNPDAAAFVPSRTFTITPDPDGRKIIDGSTYLPGDLIQLSGNFKSIQLSNILGNSTTPIVIQNKVGEITTIGDTAWDGGSYAEAFKILNCKYFRLWGTNINSLIINGTTTSNPSSKTAYYDLMFNNFCDNFRVCYLTIKDGGTGLWCKKEVDANDSNTWYPNKTLSNIEIDNIKISGTYNEGCYLGHTAIYWNIQTNQPYYPQPGDPTPDPNIYKQPILINNLKIHNMYLNSIGGDGIQMAAINGLEVYSNEVSDWATRHVFTDNGGILLGGRITNWNCHDNYVHDGWGDGMQVYVAGNGTITNNLLVNIGRGLSGNNTGAETVSMRGTDNAVVTIGANTFVNPSNTTIRINGYYGMTAAQLINNNIFAGLGFAYIYTENGGTYTEGSGSNTNDKFSTVAAAQLDAGNWYLPAVSTKGFRKNTSIGITGGSTAIIASPTSASTQITNLVNQGTYVFQLKVSNSIPQQSTDNVNVIVNSASDPIVVSAGDDQYLDEGTTTSNFYGSITVPSGSTVASVLWSATSTNSPDGTSGIIFSTPNQLNTGVSGIPVAARTTFKLSVTDGNGNTFEDTIDISVARPSEMYYTKNGVDNQYDPDDPELLAWIYLCQGYDPERPLGYDLTMYFHGVGVNIEGDGAEFIPPATQNTIEDLLRFGEGIPYYLYNKIYPMNSIVVMGQNRSGQWSPEAAQKVLNWVLANFHVNPMKVSVTGPSSGGAASFNIPLNNAELVSASIPSNATYNDVATTGNGDIVKDIAFLVVHSYNDTRVPPNSDHSTFQDIDSILAANPKGKIPPMVLMDWSAEHNYHTWDWNIYDKTRAPFLFDKDFTSFYSKDYTTTCTNFVAKAEQSNSFLDYSKALIQVSKMDDGTDKTALQARLATVLSTITNTNKYYMVNLGSNSSFNLYTINNVSITTANTVVSNLKDIQNNTSTKSFTVVTNPSGIATDNLNHDYMGMDRTMFSTAFIYDQTNPAQWKFSGLDSTKYYDVIFYHHNTSKQMYSTNNMTGSKSYINGSQQQSKLEGYNTLFTTDHYNVKPDTNGELIIDMKAITNFAFNSDHTYKGQTVAILLKEKTTTANPRSNFGKFNMANSIAANHSDWGTLVGDPTTSIRTAIDPFSGWAINTVGVGSNYWQNYGGFGNDNNVPTGAYSGILPDVVAKSYRLNYVTQFDPEIQNYNLEVIGTPGMGLPKGDYVVKVFSSTLDSFSAGRITCKIGKYSRAFDASIQSTNNTTEYLTFTGSVNEGETIKIGVNIHSTWGVAFINAVIVEKIN